MNEKDLEKEKKIKEYGSVLPNRIKHPSGKFSIIISDAMRLAFGEAYHEDLKKRIEGK